MKIFFAHICKNSPKQFPLPCIFNELFIIYSNNNLTLTSIVEWKGRSNQRENLLPFFIIKKKKKKKKKFSKNFSKKKHFSHNVYYIIYFFFRRAFLRPILRRMNYIIPVFFCTKAFQCAFSLIPNFYMSLRRKVLSDRAK
jgi:hypothetical protein